MSTVAKATNQVVKGMKGADKFFILENVVDLAGVATGDVVQCLAIGAKTLVQNVFVEVLTPTGLTSTATVGDGAGANSFDASMDLNAAAGTRTFGVGGTDAYVSADGKYYASADTIDLTCTITSGPIVAGKVKVIAICVDLN